MDTMALTASLSHISIDWLVVAGTVIALVAATMQGGAGRPAAVALGAIMASAFSATLQQAAVLGPVSAAIETPMPQALLFIALVVISYVLARRLLPHHDEVGFPLALLASVAATVALLVSWIATPALSALWTFGPLLSTIFGAAYHFWWLLATFIALAFVRG